MPKRIQRKRERGWRMPRNAIYVGRPTLYGNGYKEGGWLPLGIEFAPWVYEAIERHGIQIGVPMTAKQAVAMYREYWEQNREALLWEHMVKEFRGKDLACWCPIEAEHCHADALLEFATSETLHRRHSG